MCPNMWMFTALASSPRARLSSLTNTQGLPSHRLTYIGFAELKAMWVATVIGSCFAGAVLISRNYSKLNNGRAAFLSILVGVLGLVLLAAFIIDVPDKWAFWLIQAVVVYSIAKGIQGKVLDLHKQRGGQFHSAWRTIGISLLTVTVIIFLLAVVLTEPPNDIAVQIVAPKVVKEGERFEIQLHVRNDADNEQTLMEIEIENQYLQGIAIVSSDPSFSALEDYFSSVGYTYDLPIPPEQEIKIILQAQGVLQGDYSGEFSVCIDDIFSCLVHRVLTTVGQ